MKVYCSNCKYFDNAMFWEGSRKNCRNLICFKIEKSDNIIWENIEAVERIHDYDDLNKNNDCKYYKKKWYKFANKG